MEAPDWVCKEVERINPLARLAWAGEARTSNKEALNKGSFAIIDLYPKRMADVTFKTLWGDRGPIFGSSYDPLQRVPVWIDNVSPEDVHSGKVVAIIKRFCTDIQERLNRTWQEEQESQRRDRREMAGEIGSYMHWDAKKSLHATNVIADKHITKAEKAVAAGDVARREETPPPVHGAGLT